MQYLEVYRFRNFHEAYLQPSHQFDQRFIGVFLCYVFPSTPFQLLLAGVADRIHGIPIRLTALRMFREFAVGPSVDMTNANIVFDRCYCC